MILGEIHNGELPVLKYRENKGDELVIIKNGGELKLKNLAIDGLSNTGIADVGITTQDEPAIEHYNLFAENCRFFNFSKGRATAFKAEKSTFADSIVFKNCVFHTISGLAIDLKAEKDDLGRYNAEYVVLENCLFYNVMGSALDLYRGGNDESTTGPHLVIDQCTFHNVENKELGAAINLTGVQHVYITNSVFSHSGKSGRVIKLEDQSWIKCLIDDNIFHECGRIESFYPNRLGSNNRFTDPGFINSMGGEFEISATGLLKEYEKDGNIPGFIQTTD